MASDEKKIGIKAGIVWNTVGNFIYLFSQWLLTYVVVRALGYESAGIFSLSMALANSFFGIAAYTMRNYQTSDVEGRYSANTYIKSRYFTCAAFIVICFIYALVNGYDSYALACIGVYAIFKVTEALSDVYQGILQLRFRLDYVGISFAIKGIAEFIFFLIAILVVRDLLVALVVLTITSFAIVLGFDYRKACSGRNLGLTSFQAVKSLLIACLPMAIYGLLFNATGQIPRLFIESSLGAEALGYYTSVAMPVVIVQVSASFVFSPLVTPLAQYLHDGNNAQFTSMMKKVLLSIAVISVVSIVGFVLLGDWLLVLLFGESIAPYTYLLLPLVICTILTALAWFVASVVTILRNLNILVVLSAIGLGIVILGGKPFIDMFGMNGASFILAIALGVFTIGCSISIARITKKLLTSN